MLQDAIAYIPELTLFVHLLFSVNGVCMALGFSRCCALSYGWRLNIAVFELGDFHRYFCPTSGASTSCAVKARCSIELLPFVFSESSFLKLIESLVDLTTSRISSRSDMSQNTFDIPISSCTGMAQCAVHGTLVAMNSQPVVVSPEAMCHYCQYRRNNHANIYQKAQERKCCVSDHPIFN